MKHIYLIILLTLITYLGLGESLKFGLNGDDWGALYYYLIHFVDFQSHFDFKNFSTSLSNYTYAHVIMGIIYRLFSFNPFPYYLVSLIFRVIAAFSFYPAVLAVSKDKRAAFLSSIFFSCMFAGIETTNWVFNMNTYLSIALLNLFFYLFYSKDLHPLSKRSLLTSLVLTLSFMITQNRMHGLLFIIPLIALSKGSIFKTKKYKNIILTIAIFYLPILAYRFITRSSEDIVYLNNFTQSLMSGQKLLLSLFLSVGNAALLEKIYTIFNIIDQTKALLIIISFFALLIVLIKKSFYSTKYFFSLITLFIPFAFLIIPQLVYGSSGVLSSDQRYLIIPGSYILAMFAILLSDLLRQRGQFLKVISFSLIVLIIGVNLFSLRNYFDFLSKNGRLAQDAKRQYEFIRAQIESPQKGAPMAVLFIPDDPSYLYNAITFGFSYHMILVDPRFSLDIQKSPFPPDNIESLIDVLSGPQSKELYRYGYKPVQVPLENVYAFRLQNKNLTNITPQIREYLSEIFPDL